MMKAKKQLIIFLIFSFILGCAKNTKNNSPAKEQKVLSANQLKSEGENEKSAMESSPLTNQTQEKEKEAIMKPQIVEIKEKLAMETMPDNLYLNFDIKDFGKIKAELFVKDAPRNCLNIANLAIGGFYNGLTFHRLIPGFVIQGGDPEGTGAGGPGYTVPAEIKRKHLKGCLAMARKPDQVNPKKESSGSQFYFCLEDLPNLDGEYTVIGQIVEGMDVLEKMAKVKTGNKDRPLTPIVMEKVTVITEKK